MRINETNHSEILDSYYRYAKVTKVYHDDDTLDVTILDARDQITSQTLSKVPIFYHCSDDAEMRTNGSLKDASYAFAQNDIVVVRFSGGRAIVTGHRGKVVPCRKWPLSITVHPADDGEGQLLFHLDSLKFELWPDGSDYRLTAYSAFPENKRWSKAINHHWLISQVRRLGIYSYWDSAGSTRYRRSGIKLLNANGTATLLSGWLRPIEYWGSNYEDGVCYAAYGAYDQSHGYPMYGVVAVRLFSNGTYEKVSIAMTDDPGSPYPDGGPKTWDIKVPYNRRPEGAFSVAIGLDATGIHWFWDISQIQLYRSDVSWNKSYSESHLASRYYVGEQFKYLFTYTPQWIGWIGGEPSWGWHVEYVWYNERGGVAKKNYEMIPIGGRLYPSGVWGDDYGEDSSPPESPWILSGVVSDRILYCLTYRPSVGKLVFAVDRFNDLEVIDYFAVATSYLNYLTALTSKGVVAGTLSNALPEWWYDYIMWPMGWRFCICESDTSLVRAIPWEPFSPINPDDRPFIFPAMPMPGFVYDPALFGL